MNIYTYTPKYVCSREIRFGLEDGKVHDLRFVGGCDGNLKAIGKLLEGQRLRRTRDLLCRSARPCTGGCARRRAECLMRLMKRSLLLILLVVLFLAVQLLLLHLVPAYAGFWHHVTGWY